MQGAAEPEPAGPAVPEVGLDREDGPALGSVDRSADQHGSAPVRERDLDHVRSRPGHELGRPVAEPFQVAPAQPGLAPADAAGQQEALQQLLLPAAVLVEEPLLDGRGGLPDQGRHHRIGVPVQAGEVDYAPDRPGDPVPDRRRRAGEGLEPVDEVLAAEDIAGSFLHQHRADGVGAGHALGIAEARGQLDRVQPPAVRGLGGTAHQDAGAAVGEQHVLPGPGQRAVQPLDDRTGGEQQLLLGVEVGQVGEFGQASVESLLPAPLPGGQNRWPQGRSGAAARGGPPVPVVRRADRIPGVSH